MLPKLLFFAGLIISILPFASPPLALTLGIAFGLCLAHPYTKQAKSSAKTLLQASVIGLGFGMNLLEVLRAGRSGFLYTALGIAATLALGLWMGRMMQVWQGGGGEAESPEKTARKARKELDEKAEERVKAILTEAQFGKMPEKKIDARQPWEDMIGDRSEWVDDDIVVETGK